MFEMKKGPKVYWESNNVHEVLKKNTFKSTKQNLKSSNRLIPAYHDLQNGVDVFFQRCKPHFLLLKIPLYFRDRFGHVLQGHLPQVGGLLLLQRDQLFGPLDRALLEVESLRFPRIKVLLSS